MQSDIRTQVLGVEQIPSRDGQSIRHAVSLSGGQAPDGTVFPPEQYVTFDAGLSAKAFNLVNQPADARVEIVQKAKKQGQGFFINYTLHDVAAAGMLGPQAMPAQGGTPVQPMQYQQQTAQPPVYQPAQQQPQAPVQQQPAQVHPALAADETRQSEERRRSAMHAAFSFTGSLVAGGLLTDPSVAIAAARSLTEDLVGYVMTGNWDTQKSATPASVAQEANQSLGEGAVQVGVPFDTPQQEQES